jgi:hypothetical protein
MMSFAGRAQQTELLHGAARDFTPGGHAVSQSVMS